MEGGAPGLSSQPTAIHYHAGDFVYTRVPLFCVTLYTYLNRENRKKRNIGLGVVV